MDELIRDLQDRAGTARTLRDQYPDHSGQWKVYDGMGQAYDNAASLALQAKSRIAHREPTWPIA